MYYYARKLICEPLTELLSAQLTHFLAAHVLMMFFSLLN
jgi:hypothetical protein